MFLLSFLHAKTERLYCACLHNKLPSLSSLFLLSFVLFLFLTAFLYIDVHSADTMSGKMFRRFSTKIGLNKDKDKAVDTNGTTNGDQSGPSHGTNGTTNGVSNGTTNGITNGDRPAPPKPQKRQTFFSQKSQTQPKKETVDHSRSRTDVENTFTQFAQVVNPSSKPIPTQTGDDDAIDHPEPSGLLADIKVRYRLWYPVVYRGP